jgi:hypothetical protein
MEESELQTFVQRLFEPEVLSSIHEDMESSSPVVYLFRKPNEPGEEISLERLYSFMTVQDVKRYIASLYPDDIRFSSVFQSLLVPVVFDEEADLSEQQDRYIPFEYVFLSKQTNSPLTLVNPFEQIKSTVDSRFVSGDGEKEDLDYLQRSRLTLDSFFVKQPDGQRPVLHLFLYSDITKQIQFDVLRTSKSQWYGKIYPYFPLLRMGQDSSRLPEDEEKRRSLQNEYIQKTLEYLDNLNTNLAIMTAPAIRLEGIKFLRIEWNSKETDLETLFYKLSVSHNRPFLRLLPSGQTGITKVKLQGMLKIPDVSDPRLFLQWAQEKSINIDESEAAVVKDYMFAKLVVREALGGSLPAFYGTLRFFEDHNPDFVLVPPKQLSQLKPTSDLSDLATLLEKGISDLPFASLQPQFAQGDCMYSLPFSKPITREELRERLFAFAPVFQELEPLPGDNPLVMLRYKAIPNFDATKETIHDFLLQLTSRQAFSGDATTIQEKLIAAIEGEFQLSRSEAELKYQEWMERSIEETRPDPDSNETISRFNRGVDISLYKQGSTIHIHVYRANSIETISRILSFVSLLITADPSELAVSEEEKARFQAAAEAEEEAAEEGDEPETSNTGRLVRFANLRHTENDDESPPSDATRVIEKLETQKNVSANAPVKSYREWFIQKLQQADPDLFIYKSPQSYVTRCAANESRQPAVLSEEQFNYMKKVYENDENVYFQVYPLEEDTPAPPAGVEVYNILKFGTDIRRQNYYLCSEFFCTRDYLLIRPTDFFSTVDREGKPKLGESSPGAMDRGSCPFCHGLEIKDRENPKSNETVLRRRIKLGSKKQERATEISFLKDTFHPSGFYQPCCVLPGAAKAIPSRHVGFEKLKEQIPKREQPENDAMSVKTTSMGRGDTLLLSYAATLAKAHRKYIVGSEKFPLNLGDSDGPQIGLLPPILDTYFGQSPDMFVGRSYNKMELKTDSQAFLRVGVANRPSDLPNSFFAAIAPALGRNSAEEVRDEFLKVLTPRMFVAMNYGNLVQEFYDPSIPTPTDMELQEWAFKELRVEKKPMNQDAILRYWKSYNSFVSFMESPKTLKEYRQFAQALALPNFITHRGIICIVLDCKISPETKKEYVEVRCPPYGYDTESFSKCDITFLLHKDGVWEPIFYSENTPQTGRFAERHETYLTFQRSLYQAWPKIVKSRVFEFTTKCSGPGRAMFTSSSGIDPFALVPLSRALQAVAISPEGVIRDSYNHIVALTYRAVPGKDRLVALPVVDDGTLLATKSLYLDWDDYTPATIPEVVKFYATHFEQTFSLYPGYKVDRLIRNRDGQYTAVQLANRLFVPASPPKDEKDLPDKPIKETDEFEWQKNREIAFGTDTSFDANLLQSNEDDFSEIFQHFRLMFGNWFASDQVSPEFRKEIAEVVFSDRYALYEKRKRLDIKLGTELRKWLDSELPYEFTPSGFLRVDCRVQTKPSCSGRCVWRQGSDVNESVGQCLLHTPKDLQFGQRKVNGKEILIYRLFEELLRFPDRRLQLIPYLREALSWPKVQVKEKKTAVPLLVQMKEAVQIEDQWILPESSLAWYDLLRLDWIQAQKETKLFFEEMSGTKEKEEEGAALPPLLQALFTGGKNDEKGKRLFLYRTTSTDSTLLLPYLVPFGVGPEDIGLARDAKMLTESSAKELLMLIKRPILQIDIRDQTQQPKVLSYSLIGNQATPNPFILIVLPDGLAMLSKSQTKPEYLTPGDMPEGLYKLYDEGVALKLKVAKATN